MLMRHHRHYQPESSDYYSSLTAAAAAGATSPSLSLGIISSSLETGPSGFIISKDESEEKCVRANAATCPTP
ncbi:hypothetical protein OUZ56_019622 [Daphnia magna]|uniref:Uncharacterized protein n=1 Tax=Daphnia magna TaxID=35525 RepID=A0ABQ9ZCQ4_9CRUS|nr:hypothetical protein OUZ56_019622 [Daphnia magna]